MNHLLWVRLGSAHSAIGLLALPDSKTDRKIEMLAGVWIGMAISYFPIALFFVWFIPVILYWIGRTLKVQTVIFTFQNWVVDR